MWRRFWWMPRFPGPDLQVIFIYSFYFLTSSCVFSFALFRGVQIVMSTCKHCILKIGYAMSLCDGGKSVPLIYQCKAKFEDNLFCYLWNHVCITELIVHSVNGVSYHFKFDSVRERRMRDCINPRKEKKIIYLILLPGTLEMVFYVNERDLHEGGNCSDSPSNPFFNYLVKVLFFLKRKKMNLFYLIEWIWFPMWRIGMLNSSLLKNENPWPHKCTLKTIILVCHIITKKLHIKYWFCI